MTEMIWCKRDRTALKIIERVGTVVLSIAGIAAIVISAWFLLGYIVGMPPFDVPSGAMFSTMVIVVLGLVALGMATDMTESVKWATPLVVISMVLTLIAIVATMVGFAHVFLGCIVIVTAVIYFPIAFIRVKCMEEHHVKLCSELGREPTAKEVWDYKTKIGENLK